ncbi:MAG: enoyl-CoA hydratase/carnithine racemase [Myxococcota bacterium]|jgi:enoyl-CoA hydratase/carnithine racemase
MTAIPADFAGEAMSWEMHDDVLEVRLHREPCNEIGTAALDELDRLAKLLHHTTARACILYSDRERGFCAGADLKELYDGLVERAETSRTRKALRAIAGPDLGDRAARRVGAPIVRRQVRQFIDRIHHVFTRIDTAPIPVIGMVHGVVFGGGFELMLLCDIVVAEQSTRFAFPELRLGLVPGFGGLPRLSRDVGNAVIRDLLLTGRTLGAKRAYDVGLVSQVVPRGKGLKIARKVAAQTAKFDPHVVAMAKPFAKPVPRAELEREKDLFCRMVTDPVVLKALERFVNSDDARPYLP